MVSDISMRVRALPVLVPLLACFLGLMGGPSLAQDAQLLAELAEHVEDFRLTRSVANEDDNASFRNVRIADVCGWMRGFTT